MSDTPRPITLLAADVEIQAGGSAKRFSGTAYSGSVMTIAGHGPLAIDLNGLEIPATVPIRVDHGDGLTAIIGQGQCRIEAGRLLVSGVIAADTDAGKHLTALAKAGVKLELSVGARPLEKSYVPPREVIRCNGRALFADEGFMLVSKSKLYEISIVDRGADVGGTSLNIAAGKHHKRNANMETTQLLSESLDEIIQAAELDEPNAKWVSLLRARAMGGEIDVDQFRDSVIHAKRAQNELATLRASRPKGPIISAGGATVADPRRVVEGMILGRLGRDDLTEKYYGPDIAQLARDQRPGGLVEIIRAGFALAGRDAPRDVGEMIRASGPSTIDVPTALGGSMDKIAMDAYRQAAATWRSFCAVKPTMNFRTQTGIRINDLGVPSLLPPSGELKHTSLSESTYEHRVDTYGLRGVFTRQSVINDELGLLQDAAMSAGRGAVRKQSDVCYTVLLANGGSFFSAGNGNYFEGAGTTLQSSQLAVALKMMRQQTSASGDVLDIQPASLNVPPELETTARELLQSDFIQRLATESGPTGNVWKGSLSLEVEPRLSASSFSGYSTTAWYLFASPVDAPMIATFLNGQEAPTVEFFGPEADPGSLSYSWRVYSDFGFALADPKAAVKSKGAA